MDKGRRNLLIIFVTIPISFIVGNIVLRNINKKTLNFKLMTYIKKYVLKKSNTLKITHVKKNFHITSIVKPDGLIFLQEYNKHAENISYVNIDGFVFSTDELELRENLK